jgi:hypothetical protein
MNTRLAARRFAGWAAILSGVAAILAMVTLILFFALEMDSGEEHLWGPLSDLFPIIQMALLIVVARGLYVIQRPATPRTGIIGLAIGVVGMLGVIVLQTFLRVGVMQFAQEIGPLVIAFALVGVWLMVANYLGRQRSLPSRLAWLGMAVGAAYVLEPVIVFVAGGADWRAYMSNPLLVVVSAVIFLLAYVGFPIWAIWLGRVLLATNATEEARLQVGLVPPRIG